MTYSGDPYSGFPYSGEGDPGVDPPIEVGTIPSRRRVPGPNGLTDPYAPVGILVGTIPSRRRIPGPVGLGTPTTVDGRPMRPLAIEPRRRVPGPFLPPEGDGVTFPIDGVEVPAGLTVADYPNATAVQAHPRLNDPGQGTFTTAPPGPSADDIINIDLAGRRIFDGFAAGASRNVRAASEESGQLTAVELVGLLDEWSTAVILPDFGARGPSRLGHPTQDVRIFDWTMNGAGAESFGGAPLDLVPSVSIDTTEAVLSGLYPLPDVWPDPNARIMWVDDPRTSSPRGWCHFRVPTPTGGGTTHLWAAASDYTEVWLDGVPMLICDSPWVAQHVVIDASAHSHNVTIRAYNDRGRAGILFSMLPVDSATGLYGPPTMNSRSNWKCIAYTRRSFVNTPGQVLLRLRLEANDRNIAGVPDWRFTFTGTRDSAGRPWPRTEPLTVNVGTTMLDVLNQLAEDRIDYAAAPAGRVLHAWVKDQGTGRSRGLPWTEAVDLSSRTTKMVAR